MSTIDATAMPGETTAPASEKPLSVKEKISYGFGDFGNGFMFDLGQAYLTKFWIDVCGIGPGIVTAIFTGTKLFDACIDPVAASWIDSRRIGPRGKFRPVMMGGALCLAVMTVITFTMPSMPMGATIAWALGAYMLWGVFYSFANNPYGSLASVMTRRVKDRSELASTRQIGSLGAQWITGFTFLPILGLLGGGHHAWAMTSLVMAAVGIGGFYICYRNCHERVNVIREVGYRKNSVKDYARVVFSNRPLAGLILMTLFTISSMNVNMQMMVFFCEHNLGRASLQPVTNFVMMGVSIIPILLIPKMVTKWGKKRTAIGGCVIGAAANLVNFILPTNPVTFIILVTIGYAGLAIPNGVTWAFVSDTIDYAEWHTGVRKETMTYAAFNFSRKIAQSLAALVGAGMLALTGYHAGAAHQSARTLLGLKSVMTLYPAGALVFAMIMLLVVYNLTDDRYRRIAADLDAGRWEHGLIADQLDEK